MKILFAGTPDFAVPTLKMLLNTEHSVCAVYTQPDRPAGRGRKLKPSPIKSLAIDNNIPVVQPVSLNNADDIDRLVAFGVDLVVVVAYGMILPQALFGAIRLGCVNIHASLLPRWRGAAPIQQAILAGDKETGVTLMQVEKKLDSGPILYQIDCKIGAHESAVDLYHRLSLLGAQALEESLPDIEAGTINPRIQQETKVTHAEKLKKSDAVINWSESAIEIERKVRAYNPWPVAQTLYQDQVLRVWQAEAVTRLVEEQPGSILISKTRQLDVATRDGILRVYELQLPGGKRISTEAFLAAHPIERIRLGGL